MTDFERCQVCYTNYDLENHIAVTLSQCGHNLCKFCADNILKSSNKACPACRKPFPFGFTVTKYSVDLNIREKVEYTSKFQACPVHEGKVLDLYCRTDKRRICVECQYSNEAGHKGHIVERIVDLEPIIKPKLQKFAQKSDNYMKAFEEGKKVIEKSRQEELESFKNIERVTKMVALESFINSKAVLDNKEKQFEDHYGEKSEAKKQLDRKVTQYPYKYLQDADFIRLVENESAKDVEIQEFGLEKLSNEIKQARSEIPKPTITQDQSKVKIEAPKSIKSAIISSCLHFELRNGELIVNANDEVDKNTVLNMELWEKEVKSISFSFNKFKYNEDDNLLLEYVMTRLQNQIHSVSLEYQSTNSILTPKTRFEEHLIDFPRLIFSQPQILQSIRLRFFKSNGSDRLVRLMTEKILPRAQNLESFALLCENTDLEENSLVEFAKVLSTKEKLTAFQLTLKKTSIQPQSFAALTFLLPNLDSFSFSTDVAVGNSVQTSILKFLQSLVGSTNGLTSFSVEFTNQAIPEPSVLFKVFYSDLKNGAILEVALPGLVGQAGKIDEYKNRLKVVMKESNNKLIKIKLNSEVISL